MTHWQNNHARHLNGHRFYVNIAPSHADSNVIYFYFQFNNTVCKVFYLFSQREEIRLHCKAINNWNVCRSVVPNTNTRDEQVVVVVVV